MREFIWIISDNTSEDYLYEIINNELSPIICGDYYHNKAKDKIEGFFIALNGVEYKLFEVNAYFTSEDMDMYLQNTVIIFKNDTLALKTIEDDIYSVKIK